MGVSDPPDQPPVESGPAPVSSPLPGEADPAPPPAAEPPTSTAVAEPPEADVKESDGSDSGSELLVLQEPDLGPDQATIDKAPAVTPNPSDHHQRVHEDHAFGYDPWLNDHNRPDGTADHERLLEAIQSFAAAKIFTGADTIGADIGLLPNGLDMYASYVDNFGGFPALVRRFGAGFHGLLLSYTIFGNPARAADVQPGAMRPGDLPHWLDHTALKDGGQLAWVYTSASSMGNCNAFIGGRHVVRVSAHYGHGPHICGPHTCGWPQADWTQWDDKGPQGQNYDRNVGTYLPQSNHDPVIRASGVFRALLEYDHDHGHISVTPQKGHVNHWGNFAESAHWDIGLELGGPKRGAWSVKSLRTESG